MSDMYLPLSVIKKILRSSGYDESDKVFLSSAIGKTKFTGDIYPYVVEQLGCNPEDILHIGDNYHSDVLNTKANGLLSYFY
ncbi:HAD-IA family hydrolase [Moorena producens JHB]|uniref:HAD-IA family hydrolase n=1 Tax=Moorena producens (strain JHB) TaxID=1454205 RepID=A0A1D9G3R9_MOOP1|nr:HAD-IA family hydrolase [Moorena producens]AOY82287.2 HAD-IA family hydrolase [Moorena producens JHB]